MNIIQVLFKVKYSHFVKFYLVLSIYEHYLNDTVFHATFAYSKCLPEGSHGTLAWTSYYSFSPANIHTDCANTCIRKLMLQSNVDGIFHNTHVISIPWVITAFPKNVYLSFIFSRQTFTKPPKTFYSNFVILSLEEIRDKR